MQFTQEQVTKLAPDDASAKAGKALASNSKWVLRCVHEKALWGDCQGSGKNPYRTIIDLTNLAFKCSCPSRKFPCKHGLGLLFLYAANPNVFSVEKELPEHVGEWLGKRAERAESKPVQVEKAAPDEQAQQKRIEAREKKVRGGIEELRFWMKDVVRTGIMNVPQDPYQFNQNIIARMVDSQAAGLANQLRRINKINFYQEGWQKALIKQLSKTYLITEAYENIEALNTELQSDIKTLIGWNTPKEDVLNSTGIKDEWLILSISNEEEGNLRTEKIWLFGLGCQKFALILNFYAGAQLSGHAFVEGGTVKGELAFYPSTTPLRGLMKEPFEINGRFIQPGIRSSISTLLQDVTSKFSLNPFVSEIPFILSSGRIALNGKNWYIIGDDGSGLRLSNNEEQCWTILSISKGKMFPCFGIYENESYNILALWPSNRYYSIK
ncbi:SWIM zinc finger family protein [Desertivirga arenae]|uniref:SWIM zinc finger family protein n=1 Tax=Desertivirga arenae TaxID=2810309 RepID=UPI001A95BEC8|nr:SWIM zinc finger family protein [Pedobacter sp. SYSU D00823]